ncbi:RNA polymerase sigma factor [Methylomonas koyamae]|uniref:RNA polymerase sigma factor n=1 Tax=Methylomonas koyamae TaxID=702114 RepID=UPI001C32C074|nr:RNA polymerase sigma factor [Methylomonas koyamae]BBL59987.1 DNA-directed RNA polymerase sigma-70 factor [Methylomonas koyamae]
MRDPDRQPPTTVKPTAETAAAVRNNIDALYRAESRRVFATLIRLLGDFDIAEEALHDAFRSALEQWPRDGIPANPRAWLVSAGRFKGVDKLRRQSRYDLYEDMEQVAGTESASPDLDGDGLEDDRLRLIFTCCHPALPAEAQVALTLREVCGLATEEIARAFLLPTPTLAQRIVRVKAKIRDAKIPYRTPERGELTERLPPVLQVVYLVFNEGYSASSGPELNRPDLSAEAIRLGRLLLELLPAAEVQGLLALMLLHESRRPARCSADGELVLLEEQDRSLWASALIEEGLQRVEKALRQPGYGVYALQAAIAAVHAGATSAAATDWRQIAGLYEVLLKLAPSPVIALNRAVAIAMRDGPAAGLALIDAILAEGNLADYHLAHAARADLLRRLGRTDSALHAYQMALALAKQEPERRFLQRRIGELGG